ncbi:ABC transporter substrate-binding protein [Micropruina sp.]|uniref:ABC transporter substrate-binding protein n=1 Tax=Micropruina sp. TaxID=2737536 RepID=UPI0039E4F3D6
MPPRRRRVRSLLALVLYLSLVAGSLAALLSTAGDRSITVLCSSIEQLCRDWANGFSARTGIEVTMIRLSTGEALTRLSTTEGRREFDVWHGGPADSYVLAAQRGLLAPYRSPEADAVPERYRDPDSHWTGVYLGVLGFCSDTRALQRLGARLPSSWEDLLQPALSRQVSAPNPLRSGTGYTLVFTQRVRLGSDQAALDFLTRLDANVLQYTASGLAPAGIAARGEAAVGIGFTQHCTAAIDGGNSHLVISYPADGTGYEVGSVAVLAGTDDAEAAHRYVDYAVSREGQLAGGGAWAAQLPTRADVPADPRLGADAVLLEYTPQQAAQAREQLLERFGEELLR